MFFIIAGEVGSGKSTIATQVAQDLSLPYFCPDEIKHQVFSSAAQYQDYQSNGKLMPLELRFEVARRVEEVLRCLAANGAKDIIFDENMYKAELRVVYYRMGLELFGAYKVALVMATNKVVAGRLAKIAEAPSHSLKDRMAKRLELESEFDSMPEAALVIENSGSLKASISAFRNFVLGK